MKSHINLLEKPLAVPQPGDVVHINICDLAVPTGFEHVVVADSISRYTNPRQSPRFFQAFREAVVLRGGGFPSWSGGTSPAKLASGHMHHTALALEVKFWAN